MTASTGYAVIAGTAFTDFGAEAESRDVMTRFGQPSAPVRRLRYGDLTVLYLARHGERHDVAPHRINYRANLAALAMLGARNVIAINTVGIIGDRLQPGSLAVPHQLVDYTSGRVHTIYDSVDGELDHIDFTEPFSAGLRSELLAAARAVDVQCHDGGVYGVTQGPRLETAAEVDRYERDGVDYLGMTAMPEAALAREMGMDYACLSLVVNRAAGRGPGPIHADIEASALTAKMQAMKILKQLFSRRA